MPTAGWCNRHCDFVNRLPGIRKRYGSQCSVGKESERREVGEENDDEHCEQRAKDAGKQPELAPSQNDNPVPARAAGWRQTRFLMTESGLSQNVTSRRFDTETPFRPLLFRDPWKGRPGTAKRIDGMPPNLADRWKGSLPIHLSPSTAAPASADGMTGTTSKATRSCHCAIHWSSRRRSSQDIT
jgi:hypothetical protein